VKNLADIVVELRRVSRRRADEGVRPYARA